MCTVRSGDVVVVNENESEQHRTTTATTKKIRNGVRTVRSDVNFLPLFVSFALLAVVVAARWCQAVGDASRIQPTACRAAHHLILACYCMQCCVFWGVCFNVCWYFLAVSFLFCLFTFYPSLARCG